ncbi:MAG: BamA/TamA family outer membrane protein [Acidobacteria bacterium]|nr:BamA/TamA family outer membrane protein [Acidobacteriota bacterium]
MLLVLGVICLALPAPARCADTGPGGPPPGDPPTQAQPAPPAPPPGEEPVPPPQPPGKAPAPAGKDPLPVRQDRPIALNPNPSQVPFDTGAPSPKPPGGSEERPPGIDFVVAPIPFSNPTTGAGLAVVAGLIYPLRRGDTVSPPSTTFVGGAYSRNKTWGAGIVQQAYLKEDRFRVRLAGGGGRLNWDYYNDAAGPSGTRDLYLALSQSAWIVSGEFLFRLRPHLYLGPTGEYLSIDTTFRSGQTIPPELQPLVDRISNALQAKLAMLGFHLQYDSRSNTFYPKSGRLLDVEGSFYNRRWGSDFDYAIYEAAYNQYHKLGDRQVLAWRVFGRYAAGDPPFFALSSMGRGADLRGYSFGKYNDRLLMDAQVEFRRELWWRLSGVAFAGVGGVGERLSDLDSRGILTSYGCGLRFRLSKTNPLNFRVDLAFTRDGHALILGVGEAF